MIRDFRTRAMKCVFVTVGTTSFDDLIACVSAHDSLQVSGGGGQAKPSSPRLARRSPPAPLRPTLVTSPLPRGRKEPARPDFRGHRPSDGSSPRPARPRLRTSPQPRASAFPADFLGRSFLYFPRLSRPPSPHSPPLPPRSQVSLLPVSPPLWCGLPRRAPHFRCDPRGWRQSPRRTPSAAGRARPGQAWLVPVGAPPSPCSARSSSRSSSSLQAPSRQLVVSTAGSGRPNEAVSWSPLSFRRLFQDLCPIPDFFHNSVSWVAQIHLD